jgi:putative SOS response-associated peptidase YedK
MCGRYTYYSSEEVIEEFELLPKSNPQLKLLDIPDNFNVAPGMEMPVIIRGEQEHQPVMMIWGLIPVWNKSEKTSLKLINARKEGLFEKPMWKRLVKSHRCIVPASGFYEWQKAGDEKLPFHITPIKGKFFSFAGLWDEWTNESGSKIKTYTIITTTPNKEMESIHNRMPVILNKEQSDVWLSPIVLDQHQVDDLLKPAPNNSLKLTKVSKEVNNTRNNSEKLIYPLDKD